MLETSRAAKRGVKMAEEAAETGSQRGAVGTKRDLGSRLRVARQRAQDERWRPAGVDACSGGQAIQNQQRRGIIG